MTTEAQTQEEAAAEDDSSPLRMRSRTVKEGFVTSKAHEQFLENKNRIWVTSLTFSFFPSRFLCFQLLLGCRGQKHLVWNSRTGTSAHWPWTALSAVLHSRWRRRRQAGCVLSRRSNLWCTSLRRLHPLSADEIPSYKAAPPGACPESVF